jgi:hypothetical protein
MQHAVEREGHFLFRLGLGGQQAGLVQQVDLQGRALPLQRGRDLLLEVAQARLTGERGAKAQTLP